MLIDINKIEVGERLRSRLDPVKLRQLADDMERHGQLQEIVVVTKWGYNKRGTSIVEKATLVAGYRRLEAAKLLGWTQIRCTNSLDGYVDENSDVDLLRVEFSENELRENFTEMERVAFGVKVKERIAEAARERMLAGKKSDFDYDPETGYKIYHDEDDADEPHDETLTDDDNPQAADPASKSTEGISEQLQYSGGEVDDFAARKIGMGRNKFRQGEYVLKHGTPEQHTAIDRGEATIHGTYTELRPKVKPAAPVQVPAHVPPQVPTEQKTPQDAPAPKLMSGPAETGAPAPKIDAGPKTEANPKIPKPPKLSDKAKEELAMAMLSPKEREAVEWLNAFHAMSPDEKVVELQAQLKAERCRASIAETELSRLKDDLHNAVLHRDGIIRNMQMQLDSAHAQLEAAHARIAELEAIKGDSNDCT